MPGPVVTACWRRHRAPVTVVTASPSSPAARPTSSCPVLLPAGPANMDPAHTSSASGHRPRRCHALAPSDSPAPPPPQQPRSGTPDSPARALHRLRPLRRPHLDRLVPSAGVFTPCRPGATTPVDPARRRSLGVPPGPGGAAVSEFEHGVRVNDRVRVCLVCDSPLRSRPSYHHCLATTALPPSTEAPQRRCATQLLRLRVTWPIICNATTTRLGPPAPLVSWRVRHVSSSTTTSLSSSVSPPPAVSRASRRLRGLAPSDDAHLVRPSSSPAAGSGASSPALIGEPPAFVYVFPSG
ncbi:hypothetical protein HPB51_007546 [Rhipicephalus microplus]|uniref:Uncharacterized protein n=1 Tax=Rhipicephalus microplus TaxID=6941 RepID=A0A9J6E093_RHIMP|nr:lysine-rich arabinogalactan protein 19-like [Rhipicephalus microplus]KAH8027732.1 hypothetical protein HPB51_007546 [Rhipicephalus microplus]